MKILSVAGFVAFAALPNAVAAQSIEEKAQICAACHGENGVPAEQSFPVPVIWGQNIGYLFFQLRDFKSGARKNDQMTPVADALEGGDLMPLAQYFWKKPWPNLEQSHPADDVATVARRVNASVVCTSCHVEGFKGDSTQPRLAGREIDLRLAHAGDPEQRRRHVAHAVPASHSLHPNRLNHRKKNLPPDRHITIECLHGRLYPVNTNLSTAR